MRTFTRETKLGGNFRIGNLKLPSYRPSTDTFKNAVSILVGTTTHKIQVTIQRFSV